MTLSGVEMSIVVSAFMVFSLCSGKSVEFSRLASLAQVSSVKYDGFGNKTVACQYCNDFVKGLDEHGLKPEYNTPEKLSKGLQDTCSQVAQGSPEAAFCRQLEGQFDVFAKAYFRHMEQSWVGPCFVSGVCYVKSVGFNNLAKLSKIFALSDETVACEKIVKSIDARGLQTEYNTPEKFAKGLEEICPHAVPDSPDAEFCKALNGKYDVFAKAYFQHMEHHEIDPCKVAGVCTAKFVGFNNLASLSQVFALSDETEACKDCKHFVAYADKLPQMPEDQNTPEKLAKVLQDACADSRVPEEFCKALEGKFLVFGKAYFQHRDNHQVNPCKVAQVC